MEPTKGVFCYDLKHRSKNETEAGGRTKELVQPLKSVSARPSVDVLWVMSRCLLARLERYDSDGTVDLIPCGSAQWIELVHPISVSFGRA